MKNANAIGRSNSPSEKTALSSVRENDDGLAQTFTRSKVSSYLPEQVFDDSPTEEIPQPSYGFQPPLTQPHSRLHGFIVPADSFKGWRSIPIKGKQASRSCDDLHKLHMTWSPPPEPADDKDTKQQVGSKTAPAPGEAKLENLPSEVLGQIIDLLEVELPPNGLTTRNTDLMSLLLTSRSIHAATLNTLYRHITIPHSRIFRKFLGTIEEYPALASIVRRLDFSHFNPSTIFSSASERAQTRNLTTETLSRCLDLTPYLQEFLAQEYIDDDLDADILRKLLLQMPRIQALDFCGCSSAKFRNGFKTILEEQWPESLGITKLSFHKCISLSPAVFETILPRLHKLTHLDVAGTRITDQALLSIPTTARITHLNLAKCRDLSSEAIVKFLTYHPAVNQSLVFLSVATDASGHLLLGKDDIDHLLPRLSSTLRSLSLKGSRMDSSHVPLLVTLAQTLEELAIGRGLNQSDIFQLFTQQSQEGQPDQRHSHNLRYLDISDMETVIGSASSLLAPATSPLHVIELEERTYERAAKNKKSLERVGWTAKEFGSRYWLVRLDADGDTGARWWKMGAESWGMRKVPVAVAEVGGMYGSFMFGRR
ncbi:leucine Rich Repeat domain-containing protein [Sarocladium implicatum]|nr:leucine Rich Repeat domain-containing protein [Sarocladium implicatum]